VSLCRRLTLNVLKKYTKKIIKISEKYKKNQTKRRVRFIQAKGKREDLNVTAI